jgi:two-component sensor histidine kinase
MFVKKKKHHLNAVFFAFLFYNPLFAQFVLTNTQVDSLLEVCAQPHSPRTQLFTSASLLSQLPKKLSNSQRLQCENLLKKGSLLIDEKAYPNESVLFQKAQIDAIANLYNTRLDSVGLKYGELDHHASQIGSSDSLRVLIKCYQLQHSFLSGHYFGTIQSNLDTLFQLETRILNPDPSFLVNTRLNISFSLMGVGKTIAAFHYLSEAKSLLNKNPALNKRYAYKMYQGMSGAYYALRRYDKGIELAYKALKATEGNESQALSLYNLLGISYLNIGQLDSAYQYLDRAEILSRKNNNYSFLIALNKAQLFTLKKDYNPALRYIKESQKLVLQLDGQRDMIVDIRYAQILSAQGKHQEALAILEDLNLSWSKERTSVEEKNFWLEALLFKALKDGYKGANNTNKALIFSDLLENATDSLNQEDTHNLAQTISIEYEVAQKENQIALLNVENTHKKTQLNWLLLGLLATLVATSMIIVLYRRQQKAKDVIANQANKLSVLIKELHHRVKNNLQVVSSLLSIQSDELTDEAARKSISEGKLRVDAMSIIHQRLYMREDLAELNLREYIEDLVQHLAYSYGYEKEDFTLHLEINPILYNVDDAIPIGLMLNEVLTNSFKYAFPNHPNPTIWVKIMNDRGLEIQIKDNGLNPPSDHIQGTGFGSKLIESLSYQLNAQTATSFDEGYLFSLKSNP